MARRAMNNAEKMQAAELKKAGFSVYWWDDGSIRNPDGGNYVATHPLSGYMTFLGHINSELITEEIARVQQKQQKQTDLFTHENNPQSTIIRQAD